MSKIQIMLDAGIPLKINECDEAKDSYSFDNPTEAQLELARKIIKPPTVDELRKAEYEKRGVTIDALVIALWEAQLEGKTDALSQIQAIREQVKIDIPVK